MGTLTNAVVREAKPRAKVYELTCAGLPGFALRVLPTGKKVFVVRHRMHGQDCRVRLGLWSATLTVEEARRRAAVILGGGELDVPASPHEFDEDEQPRAPSVTRLQRPQTPQERAPARPRSEPPQARRTTTRRATAAPAGPALRDLVEPSYLPAPAVLAGPVESSEAPASDWTPARSARAGQAIARKTARHAPAFVDPSTTTTSAPARLAPAAPSMPTWTPARRVLAPVAPVEASAPQPREPTLRELAERYRSEYIDVYLKPRTASNYRHYLDTYILPALGDRPFTQVTRSSIQSLHASLREHPAAGDYILCVIGSMYTRIIRDWELADMRNPVSNTKRFGSRRVERFLTPEERRTLEAVLHEGVRMKVASRGYIEPMSAWALQLLAHTGLRKDEIISLKWPMIDWQHAVFNLPDTKTGQRSVPVSSQVMVLLREIQEHTGQPRTGYVIRSRTGRRLTSLNKTWERIRAMAGIPDVRLHDLRHSFASDALMGGVPLAIIGKILGHRQASTTQRYAHLSDRVVRDAIELTSARIAEYTPLPSTALAVPPFKPLTNAQWAKIAPIVLPGHHARTHASIRKSLDGIRWVLHHSTAWHKIPSEYGASTTCWRWHQRWQEDGVWIHLQPLITPPSAR